MEKDMIVILDLGSRKNSRLVREILDLGVHCELYPHNITLAELNAFPKVKGVILNGGPNRVVNGVELDAALEIYNAPMPVLMVDHKGDDPWPEDEATRKQALSNFIFGLCGANMP